MRGKQVLSRSNLGELKGELLEWEERESIRSGTTCKKNEKWEIEAAKTTNGKMTLDGLA